MIHALPSPLCLSEDDPWKWSVRIRKDENWRRGETQLSRHVPTHILGPARLHILGLLYRLKLHYQLVSKCSNAGAHEGISHLNHSREAMRGGSKCQTINT